MPGTRRTVILATSVLSAPLLACNIVAGKILHGGVGRNKNPEPLTLGKGLTAAFKETLNQTYTIKAEEEQSGGGGQPRLRSGG